MNKGKYIYIIVGMLFILMSCQQQKEAPGKIDGQLTENDSLTLFAINLIKKLDNRIKWTRAEFDSLTSKRTEIHRPVCSAYDKNAFVESVRSIDLSKYFAKGELNEFKPGVLGPEIIKRYNSVGDEITYINSNTIKYWYQESDRLMHHDPGAEIPPSFHWYFSVSKPILSKCGQYIYLELFECNSDREVFWIYIFKKENHIWKRLYVKETKVKMQ